MRPLLVACLFLIPQVLRAEERAVVRVKSSNLESYTLTTFCVWEKNTFDKILYYGGTQLSIAVKAGEKSRTVHVSKYQTDNSVKGYPSFLTCDDAKSAAKADLNLAKANKWYTEGLSAVENGDVTVNIIEGKAYCTKPELILSLFPESDGVATATLKQIVVACP